jgi:CAAX protease family protein
METDGNNPDSQDNQNLYNSIQAYDPYPLLHPVAAGFLGLIGGFILYVVGGSILSLSLLVFGYSLDSPPANAVRILTIIGQLLLLLLPAFLFAKWIFGDVKKVITYKLPKISEVLLFSIGSIILIPLLQVFIYFQNTFIEWLAANSSLINTLKGYVDSINDLVEQTYKNLMVSNNIFETILVFITIAIIPALCEETLFRGFVQSSFTKKMKGIFAITLTALFFASYHLNPYGFISLFILGFYFGYAAFKTGSLVVPIILHFINNFSAVLLYYIIGDEDIVSSNPSGSGIALNDVLYFGLFLLLFLATFYFIIKYYSKTKTG